MHQAGPKDLRPLYRVLSSCSRLRNLTIWGFDTNVPDDGFLKSLPATLITLELSEGVFVLPGAIQGVLDDSSAVPNLRALSFAFFDNGWSESERHALLSACRRRQIDLKMSKVRIFFGRVVKSHR